jgi:hypothetical protein
MKIIFDNEQRDGRIKMSVQSSYGYCLGSNEPIIASSASILAIVVVILALFSLGGRVISLIRRVRKLVVVRLLISFYSLFSETC